MVPQLVFYVNSIGIKLPMKVDAPLIINIVFFLILEYASGHDFYIDLHLISHIPFLSPPSLSSSLSLSLCLSLSVSLSLSLSLFSISWMSGYPRD